MNLTDDAYDPYGPEAHAKHCPTHSGKQGHYCPDWDFLWICEDCGEAACCTDLAQATETKDGA